MVFAFAGCIKDSSNESLSPIDELAVADPKADQTFTIFQNEILNLKPTITQSSGTDLSNLSFKWLAYDNSPQSNYTLPRSVLSEEYELNVIVNEPVFTLGQNYVIRLEVKNNVTGISEYFNYQVLVGNKYEKGWLILEEKAGQGDLSFIFPDNTTESNIYTTRNETPLIGPRRLEVSKNQITDDMSIPGKRLYILADQGSQEYNYLTMVKKFDFSYLFFSPPPVEDPQRMYWGNGLGIAINNHKFHSNLVGGFPGIKKWGDVALTERNDADYSLAPFVASGSSYPAIVYDNLHKRFYHVRAYNPSPVAGSLEVFPSGGTTGVSSVFEMNDVGMTMVFLDSAAVLNEYNAIMKTDDNQPYLLRFKTVNTAQAPNITLEKSSITAPGILDYTAATGSTTTPHIYYSNGSTVVNLETSSKAVVQQYDMPAGESVTFMRYVKSTADSNIPQLVVATWNGQEGKVYFFPISSNGNISQPSDTFAGFDRIVDIIYKF